MNFLPGWFPGGGTPRGVGTKVYNGRLANTANQASYTFVAAALGTAAASRMVVAAIQLAAPGGGNVTVTGVTIGGITATQVASGHANVASSHESSLWRAAVPTGTTGDIVVTCSGTAGDIGIDSYSLYDLFSHIPSAVNQANATTSGTLLSVTLNIPDGGVALLTAGANSSALFTLVGVVEDADADISGGVHEASGSQSGLNAESGRTMSATVAAAATTRTLAVASWG